MTNQHYADAAAALTAHLVSDLNLDATTAAPFAKRFIEELLACGLAPHHIVDRPHPPGQATRERVREIVQDFHDSRAEQGEPE